MSAILGGLAGGGVGALLGGLLGALGGPRGVAAGAALGAAIGGTVGVAASSGTPSVRTDTHAPNPVIPDPVQNLTASVDDLKPAVSLHWAPPSNVRLEDITNYEVCFRHTTSDVYSGTIEVDRLTTHICLTRDHGLMPLQPTSFEVRAVNSNGKGNWATIQKFVDWRPGPVQNFTVKVDNSANKPFVVLSWSPPRNSKIVSIATYEVRFKTEFDDSARYKSKTVNYYDTEASLTCDSGIEPLIKNTFEVRACTRRNSGTWTTKKCFIDWPCKLPMCFVNRVRTADGTIYDCCSKQHAKRFANEYCLLPDCFTKTKKDFCSAKHEEEAKRNGFATVVEVDPRSKDFERLCKNFHSDWAAGKGVCPDVKSGVILRVVNPAVSESFEKYRRTLPIFRKNHKQCYHGSRLDCKIYDYSGLCSSDSCGICGITQQGFDPDRISRTTWQRFGPGFYFALNSSKAHDYPVHKTNSNQSVRSILLCDVALGKTCKLKYNSRDLQGPPKGCDSVYGKATKEGDLNYDEVVVYDRNAACPRYIFLY